jgi:hypothetical protein
VKASHHGVPGPGGELTGDNCSRRGSGAGQGARKGERRVEEAAGAAGQSRAGAGLRIVDLGSGVAGPDDQRGDCDTHPSPVNLPRSVEQLRGPGCPGQADQRGSPERGLGRPSQRLRTAKKVLLQLQPLTAIQQNNFTPQPAPSRAPITLTVCVTICPSTTSRQHYFHRTAPLYMRGAIIFRVLLRSGELVAPP